MERGEGNFGEDRE
jgi:hypothetical protein